MIISGAVRRCRPAASVAPALGAVVPAGARRVGTGAAPVPGFLVAVLLGGLGASRGCGLSIFACGAEEGGGK